LCWVGPFYSLWGPGIEVSLCCQGVGLRLPNPAFPRHYVDVDSKPNYIVGRLIPSDFDGPTGHRILRHVDEGGWL
jgi:hypothetical protein